MPRLRFTVRWLMVVVAMHAVILGVLFWARERQLRFDRLHRFFVEQERREMAALSPPPLKGGLTIHMTAKGRWNHNQALKYKRAARNPWLPVAPDPPEPPDAP